MAVLLLRRRFRYEIEVSHAKTREPSGTLHVLWPSSRHLSPKLRVFVDFLAANLFLRVQDVNKVV